MKHYLEITLFLIGWCDRAWARSALRGQQLTTPRDLGTTYVAPRNAKPTRDPKKPYDPEYYTTSYYSTESETDEEAFMTPGTPGVTAADLGPTTKPPQPTTVTGYSVKFEYDDLSDATYALIINATAMTEERAKTYHKTKQIWAQLHYESAQGLNDHHHEKWFKIMCHQLGVTFFNAKYNLRDYYRVRYAYYNKKEFELGYVIQEIIHKYTVILELFHTVQHRYYNNSKFADTAPSQYMLYMYTVILEQAQQIMHYCDVLSQIEKKYEKGQQTGKKKRKGVAVSQDMFAGIGDDGADPGNEERQKELEAEAKRQMELEELQKKRLAREMQKRIRQQKKDMRENTRYYSTRRTKSPRSWGRWPHHYGWSFENW